jgi:hypothetical protein
LIAVGATIAAVGATFAAAYWIYGMEQRPKESFWQIPGYLSLVSIGAGVLVMAIGLVSPAEPPEGVTQTQTGGDYSTNVQGGRDINVSFPDDRDT